MCSIVFASGDRTESVLAKAAGGANPILRHILPRGTGRNTVVRIADGGIIHIATGAFILLHRFLPLFLKFCFALLAEVALEQASERLAVAGLVAGHLI